MGEKFVLDSKEIMIYGAASVGINIYNICNELGISVVGFFDKRSEEITEFQGVKVYNIDSDEVVNIDKNIVIFVAIKNVFEHDDIVNKLLSKGFHNIIYRPYTVLTGKGSSEERKLNQIYDKFMNKELIIEEIPKTFDVFQYKYKDCATLTKTEDGRMVYVPLECLFTNRGETIKTNKATWRDIPLLSLIPHIAFFRWIDGQEGFSYNDYLKCCINAVKYTQTIKVTDQWKDNILKNRADVYYNMNDFLDRDPNFFIRNAPEAEWNENGYFNLKSGKHRAAFYIAKGKRYIPLKISEEDFEAWMSSVQIGDIVKGFKKLNIYKVNALVEYPLFYDFMCKSGNVYYRLLCAFMYKLSYKQYENKNYVRPNELSPVLISLNDDGYMGRILQKYGITVEIHNKSTVNKLLENLVIIKRETSQKILCHYALVEYKWEENVLQDIWERNIQYLIWLVAVGDMEEFKRMIPLEYLMTKCENIVKDGKMYIVCEVEKKNAVWEYESPR